MERITRRTMLAATIAGGTLAALPALAQAQPFGRVERLDPALDALIDANATVEPLTDGALWAEGPTWAGGRDGMLLFSDVRGNRLHGWSAKGGDTVWLEPSGLPDPPASIREAGTNGLYASKGVLYVADSGDRCVSRIDLRTKARTVLADRFEGKRFNSPNDLCISPRDGAIFFTDPAWGLEGVQKSPLRELDYTGVFRLGRDGKVSLIGKFDMPNGIGLSPDGRTLYTTDTSLGWLAHTLDDRGGVTATRTFIDRKAAEGGDGLTVDARGNLWASSKDGLSIFTPEGKRIGIVHAGDLVSNCEIGADGYLYMTCNHRVARVKVKAQRYPV